VNRLTSLWTRIIYIGGLSIILHIIPPVSYPGMNSVENVTFNSANGVLMLLLLALALKSWNYTWKPNLPTGKNKPYQLFSYLIALFFMIWFPFFTTFSPSAINWLEVFGNWGYALSQLNFELVYVGYALSVGLIEEGFRYGFILLLLSYFKTYSIAKAVILSSATFALLHFNNLFLGWNLTTVTKQVAFALPFSLVITAIYLYTGKLYFAIAMHSLNDLIVYMSHYSPLYQGFLNDFSSLMLQSLISILFFIFFMTGKRRQVIKQNVKDIML
ncbi:CPBP family intramembrane glutamic endopeptidase, partial [Lactobacillus psittaci]